MHEKPVLLTECNEEKDPRAIHHDCFAGDEVVVNGARFFLVPLQNDRLFARRMNIGVRK